MVDALTALRELLVAMDALQAAEEARNAILFGDHARVERLERTVVGARLHLVAVREAARAFLATGVAG